MRVALLLVLFYPLFADTNVGGLITENTVWGPTGNPPDSVYNLISQVEIVDSVSLTIQPGTRIQSVTHGFLIFGNLFACGTPEDKVLFTSANVLPNPGDWMGLWFYNSDNDTSLIKDCIIEYAQEGIRCQYSMLKLEDSRISSCSYDGIICNNSIKIINCEITDNICAGINCYLSSDSIPLYLGNNVISNNSIGISLYCLRLPDFVVPSTFSNNDSSIVIWGYEIHIADTVQWNPAIGGIDTWVSTKIVVDTTGTFNIAPGNIFKFHAGNWIEVNGRLYANGTESDSIIFTSANTTPAPGDWHGIHHYGQELPDTCVLSYCIIEYADEIHINPVRIEHTSIRYLFYGAWCGGSISNSEIHDNLIGIHYTWFPLRINDNIIRNNDTGILIEPLLPGGTNLPHFDIPNQFMNNVRDIHITTGTVYITDDYYWNPAVDSVDCLLHSIINVDSNGTFNIAPGNRFKAWGPIISYGSIIATGTDDKKICFTTCDSNSIPGSWSGINLWGSSDSSRFKHCIIKYAQDGIIASAPFIIDSSRVDSCNRGLVFGSGSITNCTVIGNVNEGILCDLQDSINITDCVIAGNQTGILCFGGASPYIYNNQIHENTEWGVYNYNNNYWIYAEYNWWGDSTGPCDTSSIDTLYNPNGQGDRVSDHVDYDPWLHWPGIEEVSHNHPVINPATSRFSVSNPFVERAVISYILEKDQFVSLNIYNALGQLVRDLENIRKKKGNYVVIWDGNDNLLRQLPGGIYWCKINCEDLNYTQKIVKLN